MAIPESPHIRAVVIISADAEWEVVCRAFSRANRQPSPFGGWFTAKLAIRQQTEPVLFFQGGWGKIAAAASAQYVIDRWSPDLLVNLGTCGGFAGHIQTGDIILVERTVVYDIIEQMGDFDQHIAHYTTQLDLSWLDRPYPQPVRQTVLVSGDRDLLPEDIPGLNARYAAVAGDWESGAIAWVAARNHTRCLILRGVSDVVHSHGGEAYNGNIQVFVNGARQVMGRLLHALPAWLARAL